jgi:hypothetical protein
VGDRTMQPERTPLQNGITGEPQLWKLSRKNETATHILCDCEGIAYLRFRHLNHYVKESGDYQGFPISKIVRFIRSAGILNGWNRGGRIIDHWRSRCKFRSRPSLYAFIHSICELQKRLQKKYKFK